MDFNAIAEKWQKVWEERRIFEAKVDEKKQKYFITVPFPYTNSPMHIGHGRTYVTADIYARYMRMKGYNVLFPFAFQFTGTPILSVADAIKRGDQDIIDFFKNVYEIDEEKIKDLSDPYKLAEYFRQEMEKTAKAVGLSVDWRRSFTTVDDRFANFIQWQFKKLKDKGKLVKETDAVGYCPRDQFPVGMHDTKGDVEPEIEKLDVIFFEGDYFYPVATSRPETVFAGVGVAISPLTTYVIAEYSGKKILLSKEAFEKLSYQKELKKVGEVKPEELKVKEAVNPVTRKKVKVVLSKLVDPSIGTGLIMLTPAHDPIHKIIAEDNGIEDYYSVISSPDLPEIPTEEIDTRDMAELKDFADQIYRIEYYKGVMKDVSTYVPDYMKQYVKEMISGKPVKDARISTVELLNSIGRHDTIYEIMNGPIYCRCGAQIVVKVIKDQWFIAYDDPEWKMAVLNSLDNINFVPSEVRKDIEKAIFNLRKRAVGRSRGLGVKLPWDENEIIDSLSDSTIYTAFYTISHLLKKANDKLFDYVFLGLGNPEEISKELGISKEEVEELRREYNYWYPVDSRHSGRDLIQNHIPYYIYNHLEILGKLPRQIVINGFVRVGGKKMSKSFRNVYPLSKAIKEYGVDPVRIALATPKLSEDVEFNSSFVTSIADQLKRIYSLIVELLETKGGNNFGTAEKWLSSIISEKIKTVDEKMRNLDFFEAYNIILYGIYNDFKDYLDFTTGINEDLIKKSISAWLRMIYPAAPHIAEELWSKAFLGLVAEQEYPKPEEFTIYPDAVVEKGYIDYVISEIKELERIVGEGEKAVIYVNNDLSLAKDVAKAIEEGQSLFEFARGNEKLEKVYSSMKAYDSIFRKSLLTLQEFDEIRTLANYANYIMRKTNLGQLSVYDSNDPNVPDFKGKKSQALPLSPSIVIFSS